MTVEDAKKWEAIARLYEKTFEYYITLASKVQNNLFPEIVRISKEAMSSSAVSEHVDQIQETTKEIHKKISETAEQYGKMKLDAYETAGQMYEEIGNLEHAAEMYHYSYDYCLDKSMELYEKIAKTRHNTT
jgi:uncharacterized coiled-coil DUF342 family protein